MKNSLKIVLACQQDSDGRQIFAKTANNQVWKKVRHNEAWEDGLAMCQKIVGGDLRLWLWEAVSPSQYTMKSWFDSETGEEGFSCFAVRNEGVAKQIMAHMKSTLTEEQEVAQQPLF